MSIWAILGVIIAVVAGLLGGFTGKVIGRSQGRKEGAEQVSQEQQITQAKETVKAVQERARVEKETAATPGSDLDERLSEFSRPD